MKRILFMLAVFTLMIGTSCKNDKKEETQLNESTEMTDTDVTEETGEMKKLQVALEPKSNSSAKGNLVFTQEDGVVTMTAVLGGLKKGTHAIHIHETADCSSTDGTSAGGHWNPTNQPHGQWGNTAGFHKGDIGNMTADAQGNATISMTTDEWCIGCGDPNKDVLGKAIIVHEGTDDFKTQPTGNAGGRISCGGIIQ